MKKQRHKREQQNETNIINDVDPRIVQKGPLGVILLRRAFDAVYDKVNDIPKTQLRQEVLYNPEFFPNLHP